MPAYVPRIPQLPMAAYSDVFAHVGRMMEIHDAAQRQFSGILDAVTTFQSAVSSFDRMTSGLLSVGLRDQTDMNAISSMSWICDQHSQIAQTFERIGRDIFAYQSALDRVSSNLVNNFGCVLASHNALRNTLGNLLDVAPQIRAANASHFKMLDSIRMRLDGIGISALEELASIAERDEVFAEIDGDGEVAIAVASLRREILDTTEFVAAPIEAKLNYLIEWTKRQGSAKVRRFMENLLCGLISSFIWWIGTTVLISAIHHDSMPSKQIVRNVREAIRVRERHDARILRRPTQVRTSTRCKASVVCELEAGSIIILVQKVGKWSQVEWLDAHSGDMKGGWVRSKDLLRIDE